MDNTSQEPPKRLDYSTPPPGWVIDCYPREKSADPETSFGVGRVGEQPQSWFTTEDGALATLWGGYQANHDPPGMRVIGRGGELYQWDLYPRSIEGPEFLVMFSRVEDARAAADRARAAARAAAWAWHDRRHGLVAKLEAVLVVDEEEFRGRTIRTVVTTSEARHFDGAQRPYTSWPACLTWTDEQVAEVERWLNDSAAEMPEVLRG